MVSGECKTKGKLKGGCITSTIWQRWNRIDALWHELAHGVNLLSRTQRWSKSRDVDQPLATSVVTTHAGVYACDTVTSNWIECLVRLYARSSSTSRGLCISGTHPPPGPSKLCIGSGMPPRRRRSGSAVIRARSPGWLWVVGWGGWGLRCGLSRLLLVGLWGRCGLVLGLLDSGWRRGGWRGM